MRVWTAFVALIFFAAGPAMAETINLQAELAGSNESPPNDSKATGAAQATLDTETRELTWTVEYSGLSGPAIGAHIHGPAAAGSNAGIMVPLQTGDSPITGSKVLSEDQVEPLLDGQLYFNIHTQAHPGGEIRGQIVK